MIPNSEKLLKFHLDQKRKNEEDNLIDLFEDEGVRVAKTCCRDNGMGLLHCLAIW